MWCQYEFWLLQLSWQQAENRDPHIRATNAISAPVVSRNYASADKQLVKHGYLRVLISVNLGKFPLPAVRGRPFSNAPNIMLKRLSSALKFWTSTVVKLSNTQALVTCVANIKVSVPMLGIKPGLILLGESWSINRGVLKHVVKTAVVVYFWRDGGANVLLFHLQVHSGFSM